MTVYIVNRESETIQHIMTEDTPVFTVAHVEEFETETPILGLDRYKPNSHGEHEFSRKQAWFYTYGDESIREEFRERLTELLHSRFVRDEKKWDMVTLYPTHSRGEVNSNMKLLLEESLREMGIEYRQVLERTETVQESHELNSDSDKVLNLNDSIEVSGDVEGKNVILLDNISLSGTSLSHGAHRLYQAGAENVFSVSLGVQASQVLPVKLKDKTVSELKAVSKSVSRL